MPKESGLWSRSAMWRWLVVFTCISTTVTVWLKPWERSRNILVSNATYVPPALTSAPAHTYSTTSLTTAKHLALTTGEPRDTRFNELLSTTSPRFPAGTEMHLVGVHKGAPPAGEVEKPWWANCSTNSSKDFTDAVACHAKYAGVTNRYTVTVDVNRAGHPLVLVLMAYNPVSWNMRLGPGVDVQKIILAGYEGQDILLSNHDIPVEARTYKASPCTDCSRQSGNFYAYESNTQEYQQAVKQLYSITGLMPNSFQGSYEASRFTISSATIAASRVNSSPETTTAQQYLEKRFSNSVMMEGQGIPLPDGEWDARIYENRVVGTDTTRFLVLTRSEGSILLELLAIRQQVSAYGGGFDRMAACQMGVGYKERVDRNDSRGTQLCYWVDPVTEPWTFSMFSEVRRQLADSGVAIPPFVLSAGFHRADRSRSLTIIHYKNPPTAGGVTAPTNWQQSPWRQDRIQQSPEKEIALRDYISWADSWYQLIKAAVY